MSLSREDRDTFRELCIKAEDIQLQFMLHVLQGEAKKRYEVKLARMMGSYGNQWVGVRLPSGKRVQVNE